MNFWPKEKNFETYAPLCQKDYVGQNAPGLELMSYFSFHFQVHFLQERTSMFLQIIRVTA